MLGEGFRKGPRKEAVLPERGSQKGGGSWGGPKLEAVLVGGGVFQEGGGALVRVGGSQEGGYASGVGGGSQEGGGALVGVGGSQDGGMLLEGDLVEGVLFYIGCVCSQRDSSLNPCRQISLSGKKANNFHVRREIVLKQKSI